MSNNESTKTINQSDNILEVSHLKKYFPIKGGFFGGATGSVKAVDDVSFNIKRGTTMGLSESPDVESPRLEERSYV